MSKTTRLALDFLERSAKTFVQAFCAALIAGQAFDASTLKLAAIAAGLAVATSIAGTRVGRSDSASLLPADAEPAGGAS